MRPQDFLSDWIKQNVSTVGIMTAQYEYQSFCETHFLQIEPEQIIEKDENQLIWSELILAFSNYFKGEALSIIGISSLAKLYKPELLYRSLVNTNKHIQFNTIDLQEVFAGDFINQYSLSILDNQIIYTPINIRSIGAINTQYVASFNHHSEFEWIHQCIIGDFPLDELKDENINATAA